MHTSNSAQMPCGNTAAANAYQATEVAQHFDVDQAIDDHHAVADKFFKTEPAEALLALCQKEYGDTDADTFNAFLLERFVLPIVNEPRNKPQPIVEALIMDYTAINMPVEDSE